MARIIPLSDKLVSSSRPVYARTEIGVGAIPVGLPKPTQSLPALPEGLRVNPSPPARSEDEERTIRLAMPRMAPAPVVDPMPFPTRGVGARPQHTAARSSATMAMPTPAQGASAWPAPPRTVIEPRPTEPGTRGIAALLAAILTTLVVLTIVTVTRPG